MPFGNIMSSILLNKLTIRSFFFCCCCVQIIKRINLNCLQSHTSPSLIYEHEQPPRGILQFVYLVNLHLNRNEIVELFKVVLKCTDLGFKYIENVRMK